MTLARTLLPAITLFACAALPAGAVEKHYYLDLAASSALHDRGEQIGRETLEFGVGAEVEFEDFTAYGSFYRLLPVGGEQEAFDDEADFTVGVAWHRHTYSADVSANWLTYPGEEAEASLELVGSVTLEAPFAPTLIGFYDADFDDWGLEVAAGPEWEAAGWGFYAMGRAGFVQPGDDSASRSYAGVEFGAGRPVNDFAEFGIFARADTADEESFAHKFENGEITSFRNSGVSVGVSLSLSR